MGVLGVIQDPILPNRFQVARKALNGPDVEKGPRSPASPFRGSQDSYSLPMASMRLSTMASSSTSELKTCSLMASTSHNTSTLAVAS